VTPAPAAAPTPAERFGVLAIPTFTTTTAADIEAALLPLVRGGARGVVIDLRGTGGGDLAQSAAAADLFVKSGVVLEMKARDPTYAKHLEAHVASPLEKLRVVILVDGGTASAAEHFAATLGDVGRAVILGHPTVAKGRAQAVIPMRSGEGLVLTVARFTGPTGATIDDVGIVPAVCENAQGQFVLVNPGLAHVRRTSTSAGRDALLRVCRPLRSRDPREVDVARRLLSDNAVFMRALSRQRRLAGTQMNATTRQDIRY
jgi:carboxyl-terminal processing protease